MKTLDDLLWLGRTEPVIHDYLMLYEKKEVSLEQALIGMVITLTDLKNVATNRYMKHIENCNDQDGFMLCPNCGMVKVD